jgi:hypothetical protein
VLQLADKYNLYVVQSSSCSFLRYNSSELTYSQPITSARNPLRAYTLVEMYLSDKAGLYLVAIEKAAADKLTELGAVTPTAATNGQLSRVKNLLERARAPKAAELLSVKAVVRGCKGM